MYEAERRPRIQPLDPLVSLIEELLDPVRVSVPQDDAARASHDQQAIRRCESSWSELAERSVLAKRLSCHLP